MKKQLPCLPSEDVAYTLKNNELTKQHHHILHKNRVILRTKKGDTEEQNNLEVTAAVCGTSSIARLSQLGGLVICYPFYRLRPSFANYAPPPERARHTIQNKHSGLVAHSHHTTPFIRTRRKKYI